LTGVIEGRLYIELFAIAKERDENRNNYILLGVSKGDFVFSNGDTFVFKSNPVEAEAYTQVDTAQPRGEEYTGYILQITMKDKKNQTHIIETKTNIAGKWVENPVLLPKLRDLWERGASSKRCRHFNKNGEQVDVPRVEHFRRT